MTTKCTIAISASDKPLWDRLTRIAERAGLSRNKMLFKVLELYLGEVDCRGSKSIRFRP